MPREDRIRFDNRGRLLETTPPDHLALDSQSVALIIGNHQALPVALLQEDSVLLKHEVDHGLLMLANPA